MLAAEQRWKSINHTKNTHIESNRQTISLGTAYNQMHVCNVYISIVANWLLKNTQYYENSKTNNSFKMVILFACGT